MSKREMKSYKVTFDRIGRNRAVAPLETKAANGDHLCDRIMKYARPHLRSRDIGIHLDMDAGKGGIICGFHSGGEFTVVESGK